MKCINCGTELTENKTFCDACGKEQSQKTTGDETDFSIQEKKTKIYSHVKINILKCFATVTFIVCTICGYLILFPKAWYSKSEIETTIVSSDDNSSIIKDKILFLKEYIESYEVNETGNDKSNFYTSNMLSDKIEIEGQTPFSMEKEGVQIDASTISVEHKEGNYFIVSYKGNTICDSGKGLPCYTIIVEIIGENNRYQINEAKIDKIQYEKVAALDKSELVGTWMASTSSRAAVIFEFKSDGTGCDCEVYYPNVIEEEEGAKTEYSEKKNFNWNLEGNLLILNYADGNVENYNVDSSGPLWKFHGVYEHWDKQE